MPPFNITGLVIASLIPLIVGSFWYMPSIFGDAVSTQNKVDASDRGKHHPMVYVGTLICSFLIAMLLSGILSGHEVEEVTLAHGAFHGFGAAVFLGIPTFLVIAFFESKSFAYIMIHSCYWLVSLTTMGAVLGFFGMG